MYKVKYYKLAVMDDGSIGNVSRGVDYCYTDAPIGEIEYHINAALKKEHAVITDITKIDGHVISVSAADSSEAAKTIA